MSGCTIGERCNIGQNVVISPGVRLGDGCKIQNNVSVYTGVECEDGVFLGPSCVFTNVINPRAFIERKSEYRRTVVKKAPASAPMQPSSADMTSAGMPSWGPDRW